MGDKGKRSSYSEVSTKAAVQTPSVKLENFMYFVDGASSDCKDGFHSRADAVEHAMKIARDLKPGQQAVLYKAEAIFVAGVTQYPVQ